MSNESLTAIGLVIGGAGVVVAAVSGALGAIFGYRAVVAGRQAVEQSRASRREERLYVELSRYERLIGIVHRMWAIVNEKAIWSGVEEHAPRTRWHKENDALLYELRAALALVKVGGLPRCQHLAMQPPENLSGEAIESADQEITSAIAGCQARLDELGPNA
jgi:hypothetical protein